MKNGFKAVPMEPGHGQEGPVFVRIDTAARLIDTTPAGLRKRLSRTVMPPGVVTRVGRTLLLNREHFLRWIAEGSAKAS